MRVTKYISLVGLLIIINILTGCGAKNSSSSSSYDTTSAEVAGAAYASAGNTSDDSNGSNVSSFKVQKSMGEKIKILASQILESKANAAACSTAARVLGQTCSSQAMSISLGGCTGYLGSWTGTENINYGTAGACTDAHNSGLFGMSSGDTATLLAPSGLTLTTSNNYSVYTDSNSSGYDTTVSNGVTIACTGATCAAGRTVTINGLHRILYGPLGNILYNHSISTPTPLAITGSLAAGTRTIQSGTLLLQHNIALYTATSQVSTPVTFTAGCCVPTGGSVVTTFTRGSKSGSETVTFGPTCGAASVNGHSLTLSYCQ